MKLKYVSRPSYPEVEVFGKTISGSVFGTIDRRSVGRRLLTLEEGFAPDGAKADQVVVDGDNTVIQTVEKVSEVEVVVQYKVVVKDSGERVFLRAFSKNVVENGKLRD